MGIAAKLIVGGAAVILVAFIASGRHGVAPESAAAEPSWIAKACADNRAALATYLDKAEQLGFIRVRGDRYQVDEASWSALEHDQKINLALAAFCAEAVDGRGVVLLKGLHDGMTKASVVDGNYTD